MELYGWGGTLVSLVFHYLPSLYPSSFCRNDFLYLFHSFFHGAPSTSVFHQAWGSIPKVRTNQHNLHNYAAADDHVASHQEFHHKLLQETAQKCTKHLTEL